MVEGKAVLKTSPVSDECVEYLDCTSQSGEVKEMPATMNKASLRAAQVGVCSTNKKPRDGLNIFNEETNPRLAVARAHI
jgi:hypothetical protein